MLILFGLISGILSAICYFPYIRDILLHKTKPQRSSWLIWSVLGGIAFFSQLARGATNSLWLTGISTLGIVIVFLLSLRFGVGGLAKKDYFALTFAVVGLILWYFSKEAAIALYITIAIDAVGGILTVQKTYLDPSSETLITWVLQLLSGLFSAFSVGTLNVVLLSYPVYIFFLNAAVISAIVFGSKSAFKKCDSL